MSEKESDESDKLLFTRSLEVTLFKKVSLLLA